MTWRITFDHDTAFVAGPKVEARRRIAVCGDSSPIWVSRRDAWATSPTVANRVLDQIEGRPVAVEDVDQCELNLTDTTPANVPPVRQGVLW